jgi:hypothetical protein
MSASILNTLPKFVRLLAPRNVHCRLGLLRLARLAKYSANNPFSFNSLRRRRRAFASLKNLQLQFNAPLRFIHLSFLPRATKLPKCHDTQPSRSVFVGEAAPVYRLQHKRATP